ncbi:hypothetical protein JS533_012225 [Bifidobacterium amazonense]|uniref:DUF5648 domain-containing protein n=1 Tax=Bifidobacterium amazonense TaxID=2809027 RepID=A0ABS9VY40_9BIFI|nr:hypothetical protein [Bifidobacterium amazonense]MCH9277021.1 hypothetical protein [Bifidobacterium amazonense]
MQMRKTISALVSALTLIVAFGLASVTGVSTANAAGWKQEGVAWMAPSSGGMEVYRLKDPRTGLHHYTVDTNERDGLVKNHHWQYEGVAFHADTEGQEVYRLYNPVNKRHNYTLDTNERDTLANKYGWRYEGVAWYVGQSADLPVYRARNLSNGEHLWTIDANEYAALGKESTKPTTTPSKPKPTPSQPSSTQKGITPGAFCSPEGAKGIGKKNGKTYTCKYDANGKLRWRQ